VFTSWYGQASCTAGRAWFMTGRIPIRSALSVVAVSGDPNGLTKSTPTIAEFFQKNGYGTYFSGKWHLGDVPKFYPIEHGFDEMKAFAAYYPGVYTYDCTENFAHPWFPKFNAAYWDEYQKIVNLYEREGTAGKPATKVARIDYDYLHEFDVRQADYAAEYIKAQAKDDKPFFMDVNFSALQGRENRDEISYWNGTASEGEPRIVIDLDQQRAYLYKGDQIVGVSVVSTGREGYDTPPGEFRITEKDQEHVSSLYGDYIDQSGQVVTENVESDKTHGPVEQSSGSSDAILPQNSWRHRHARRLSARLSSVTWLYTVTRENGSSIF
jgi:hypothetical protein